MKINIGDLDEFGNVARRKLYSAIANDSLNELLDAYDVYVPITDFTNYKLELAIADDVDYLTKGALYNSMPKTFAWTLISRMLFEFEKKGVK